MAADRKTQASALRELAKYIEDTGSDLPRDVASAVESMLDMMQHEQAVRDWRAREAQGEKTIPSSEARKLLGL